MNDRNSIVKELYCSKEFDDVINKMQPAQIRDDLRSEVALALLELPEKNFINIQNIKFYAVRIIMNMVTNQNHPFYKKFRNKFEQLQDWNEINEEKDLKINNAKEIEWEELQYADRLKRELSEEKVMLILNDWENGNDNSNWYKASLIKIYLKLGDYRSIERKTGISHVAAYNTIKKTIQEIKLKIAK